MGLETNFQKEISWMSLKKNFSKIYSSDDDKDEEIVNKVPEQNRIFINCFKKIVENLDTLKECIVSATQLIFLKVLFNIPVIAFHYNNVLVKEQIWFIVRLKLRKSSTWSEAGLYPERKMDGRQVPLLIGKWDSLYLSSLSTCAKFQVCSDVNAGHRNRAFWKS